MKYYLLLFVFAVYGCCESYSEKDLIVKKLSKRNPTSYTFNSSISDLHQIILSLEYTSWRNFFDDPSTYQPSEYNSKGVHISIYDTTVYTSLSSDKSKVDTNKIKYVLSNYDWIGKSKMYFTENGALDFQCVFNIKLVRIDKNRTKVNVELTDMYILLGKYFNLHCQCCAYNSISVKPSSIEEYKFLLKLGELSGEKNMPALILPS